jgi:hypothetical protein
MNLLQACNRKSLDEQLFQSPTDNQNITLIRTLKYTRLILTIIIQRIRLETTTAAHCYQAVWHSNFAALITEQGVKELQKTKFTPEESVYML